MNGFRDWEANELNRENKVTSKGGNIEKTIMLNHKPGKDLDLDPS